MESREYWVEVAKIAASLESELADEFREEHGADVYDWPESTWREQLQERCWETVDGHQWVIYTAYNFDVMKHSNNDGYSAENFGAESIVTDGVLNTAAIAFGALYADVMERLTFDPTDLEVEAETEA